jgi:manganese-dependent inorganic pyrophosphatase
MPKRSNIAEDLEKAATYITPYQNPDLDGVASAIGYALLETASGKSGFEAAYWGAMNSQTKFVLDYFGIQRIEPLLGIPSGWFVLVDTHHVNQLPDGFPCEQVIEIVDHHPGGDPAAFPNARIQNEEVGAAATLIAEKYFELGMIIPPETAGMLACAILSNTIRFAASSTTERDRKAFACLKSHVALSEALVEGLFAASFPIEAKSSIECIREDIKIFTFGQVRVGLSQLEAIGIEGLFARSDFEQAMQEVKGEKSLDHLIFNGIDVMQKKSLVKFDAAVTAALFSRVWAMEMDGTFIRLDRIILRKSDLVIPLQAYFLGVQ